MHTSPFLIGVIFLAALIPAMLIAVVLFLALYSWPAINFNGVGFLFRTTWNLGNLYADPVMVRGMQVPMHAQYGILVSSSAGSRHRRSRS